MDLGQRIAIIGAGAWGLSAAYHLAKAGHTNVHVYERDHPGSGNTAFAAGLVSTHLRLESDIRLVLETERELEALRQWGHERGRASADAFRAIGSLTVSLRRDEDRLDRLRDRIRRAGGASDKLSGPELDRWGIAGAANLVGVHSASDGYVEAGDLMDLLQARTRDLGVHVHAEKASALTMEDDYATGVKHDEGRDAADTLLLAAGAWSKRILEQAGHSLPLKPYRTQLAQLEFPRLARAPVFHDMEQFVYARPDGTSNALVGDGTEFVESDPETFNRGVDRPFLEKVAHATARRWKEGGQAKYRKGWSGLCVATPDREPLIGPDPRIKRLHLMVGDNGFGVMRCLALGRLAAARVAGRMLPEAAAYAPKRLDFAKDFPIREGFELS